MSSKIICELDAIFDGETFRPEGHINLPAQGRYTISVTAIETEQEILIDHSKTTASGELADKAWQIYDQDLKHLLEPEQNGKLVAIHLETGDFEVQRTSPKAWKELRKRRPRGTIDVIDIGPVSADNPLSLRLNDILADAGR